MSGSGNGQHFPKLALPAGDFKAYLFDCDGTIVDSMPLHYVAWSTAFSEWNCPFPEDLFYALGGVPIHDIIQLISGKYGIDIPVDEVALRKEALYYENLPSLKAVPEVIEHIDLQYGRIPFAVVSGSPRKSIEASLNRLGILDKFEILVGAEDYKNAKPHPEPFLNAARLLDVPPESCLVFEDSDLGIDSAKAAGMAWVKVPPPNSRQ